MPVPHWVYQIAAAAGPHLLDEAAEWAKPHLETVTSRALDGFTRWVIDTTPATDHWGDQISKVASDVWETVNKGIPFDKNRPQADPFAYSDAENLPDWVEESHVDGGHGFVPGSKPPPTSEYIDRYGFKHMVIYEQSKYSSANGLDYYHYHEIVYKPGNKSYKPGDPDFGPFDKLKDKRRKRKRKADIIHAYRPLTTWSFIKG